MITENQKLAASLLHDIMCKASHIDGCSWDYENWDGPNNGTRIRYLDKVKVIIKDCGEENTIKVLQSLKKAKVY